MDNEVTVRCAKCRQSAFQFSVQLIELRGEVVCECKACGSIVRVTLNQDEVRIVAQ